MFDMRLLEFGSLLYRVYILPVPLNRNYRNIQAPGQPFSVKDVSFFIKTSYSGHMLGFGIILLIFFLGEAIHFLGVPLPGSVVGMLLLTAGLASGIIRRKWIASTADFLLRNLSFFFVPAGVGIMAHTELFKAYWFEILFAVIFSFVLVLVAVGMLQRLLTRKGGGDR